MRDAVLRGRDLCSSEDPYVQVRAEEPWNQVRDRRGSSAVKAVFCGHEPSDAQRFMDGDFLVFDQKFNFHDYCVL